MKNKIQYPHMKNVLDYKNILKYINMRQQEVYKKRFLIIMWISDCTEKNLKWVYEYKEEKKKSYTLSL